LIALTLAVLLGPPIALVPDPPARVVVVHAMVLAPGLRPEERPAWRALARVLRDGTRTRTRADLASLSFRAEPLAATMTLSVQTPRANLGEAVDALASVVTEPSFDPEDLAAACAERPLADPWTLALVGDDGHRAEPDAVRELYRRAFRPERVRWAIGGGGDLEAAQGRLAAALADWRPPRAPTPRPARRIPERPRRGDVRVLELRGETIRLTEETAPTLVALFALGVGKQGALHRVAREAKGWSYRQELVLWPEPTGWRPRLVLARAASGVTPDELRAALFDDVATWTDETRLVASAMLSACLGPGMVSSPWYLGPKRVMDGDVYARTDFALWFHLHGAPHPPLAAAETITLDQLRKKAASWLRSARAVEHR
jgi:hypothetical protein